MATAKRSKKRRRDEDDEDVAPRRRSRSSDGGGSKVKFDFRNTEKGRRGGMRLPEGEYKVKILKAERAQAQTGTTQIKLTYKIIDGVSSKAKGKQFTDYLQLTEKAMHRVGWLLDAAEIKWNQKLMTFDLKKLVGKTIGIALYDDPYKGKVRSKVSEYYTKDEVDEYLSDEDEDEDDLDDEDDDDLDDDEDEEDDEDDEDEDDEDDEDDDDEDEDDL